MTTYDTAYVDVNGIRTHYLEAGRDHDETVLLVHSGEFGAAAEFSWSAIIDGLAEQYHVLAPDMIGYGHTEKLFSFEDQFDLRVSHVGAFLETLCVDQAHVVGNSLGGGDVLSVASEPAPCEWPIEKAVSISGGGGPPDQFQDILTEFDGSRDAMADILDVLFAEEWWDESYLDRRVEMSRVPGQWQATAAIRFEPPFEQDRTFRRSNRYDRIDVPTLVVAGADDVLKSVDKMRSVHDEISDDADTRFEVIEDCGHCAQIEQPDRCLEVLLDFLEE
ncbi:alpha/beta fold hydrolase [Natrarchaeobius chitinivorans]|uniref:Alpha/beta hydrolase n=1 Tax=Natrarchaeobius chitinivorans TaxID=1679083 RepID=A0A3N6NA01_NATCH|nr:alpha/beta hydrolase [Natrarchaeobius chitinivorans]RQG95402.1 alpha/beta hydrolase [Natrarchaeobius chitinivorans]